MGLRCLIGHDYGEPRTSRDRSERGNEVVVTVREYRECTRCGHRRVISENKEVTAGPTADADDASAEASWAPDEEAEPEPSTVEAFARSSADPAGVEEAEPMTAAEDDGIILEDEPPQRARGEWPEDDRPEADDEPDADHAPWPDEGPGPAPTEPQPPDPADDPLDTGPEPTTDAAAATDEPGAVGSGQEVAAAEPTRTPRPDDRDTEFVCPDCGETWPTLNASLRPGDICPECRSGYLEEQVVQ